VRFDPLPVAGDTIFWSGLSDSEGTPVADWFAVVPNRPDSEQGLFLTSWKTITTSRAELTFNLPLDRDDAVRSESYRVDPTGSIASVQFDAAVPDKVVLEVVGRALGPTGLQTSIVVLKMKAEDGTGLASEGTVATFLESAASLTEAYIFPNPYREGVHGASLMIAGLPNRSKIQIFSPSGLPVRSLEELDGDGGVAWDLANDSGVQVESGIYIVRIETESEDSVILKSAVIR
ncbi:T9SS type A sorting domain-containing protein, partial [Bacteroidota bacterium]